MRLDDLRDAYRGRCFILGTGPSLLQVTPAEREALGREYTFGCSRYWKWENPIGLSFYVVAEQDHVTRMRETGTSNAQASIARFMLQFQPPQDDWIGLPVDKYRQTTVSQSGLGRYPYVHQAVSETLIALQVAVWMGFDQFYFLGNELTRVGEVWDPQERRHSSFGTVRPDFEMAARALDGRLLDCTPGGALSSIMPFQALSEVLEVKI